LLAKPEAVPRQELGGATDAMPRQPLQDVAEIGLRIEAVEAGSRDERGDRRGSNTARI
jgi:hypothetical protein